jgi:hypothetical protein
MPSTKVQFDKLALLGYKLVSKRVPRVRTMKNGSQIVRYTMINEDLATLGVTQMQLMQSRMGQRSTAGNGSA